MLIVVKLGTSSIVDESTGYLRLPLVAKVVDTVCMLRRAGNNVILVTSGSIGTGRKRMGAAAGAGSMATTSVALKQAFAAIGQGRLLSMYDDLFSQYNQVVAQILLSRQDLAEYQRFANVRACFSELLAMGVVPIVNENDSVSVDGVKFGDNDTLAGLVAGMLGAHWLFLLTDVDALYTCNPVRFPGQAQRIPVVRSQDQLAQIDTAGRSASDLGTGGMATKLMASRLVSNAGARTCILLATRPELMAAVIQGSRDEGTVFEPSACRMRERKWWIMYSLNVHGVVLVDDGAADALLHRHALHAVGVTGVQGVFAALSCVQVVRQSDQALIGRGLVNFSSAELEFIRGKDSKTAASLLQSEGFTGGLSAGSVPPYTSVISYRSFVVEYEGGQDHSRLTTTTTTATSTTPIPSTTADADEVAVDRGSNVSAAAINNQSVSVIGDVADAFAQAADLLQRHSLKGLSSTTTGFLPSAVAGIPSSFPASSPFARFDVFPATSQGLAGGPTTRDLLAALHDDSAATATAAAAAAPIDWTAAVASLGVDNGELERAMTLLTYLASACVWGPSQGAGPPAPVPAAVAVPLTAVARRLNRRPMTSHATTALFNWRRKRSDGPLVADNVDLVCSWTGGPSEHWFLATAVEIEADFGGALLPLVRTHFLSLQAGALLLQSEAAAAAAAARDQLLLVVSAIVSELTNVAVAVDRMTAAMSRIKDRCDPAEFYRSVRPYVQGYGPPGVMFEGVREAFGGGAGEGAAGGRGVDGDGGSAAGPHFFAGGSAGQSPSFQLLDLVLGVQHTGSEAEFFAATQPYMKTEHRELLAEVRAAGQGPHAPLMQLLNRVDRASTAGAAPLVSAWQRCRSSLTEFRNVHLNVVVRYIVQQSNKEMSEDQLKGTGGSDLSRFLKNVRNNTK